MQGQEFRISFMATGSTRLDLNLKFPEIGECNRCQRLSRLGATVLVQRVVFAHVEGATGSRRLTARLEPLWLRY